MVQRSRVRCGWRFHRERRLARAPANAPCPGGCGFAITFHATHCCEVCRLECGHGPRCEHRPAGRVSQAEAQALIAKLVDTPRWQASLQAAFQTAHAAYERRGGRGGGQRLPLDRSSNLRLLHESPPVFVCDDFLGAAQCETMIRLAPPLLVRSNTAGNITDIRTSRTCHLPRHAPESIACFERVARLTGRPFAAFEDVQVARYERGERYDGHFDGASPTDPDAATFFGGGGQRLCTVLIYLNDVARGGTTRFPLLDNLEVAPRRGRAVVFFPGFVDGTLDPQLFHEARPAQDVKWVSQVWVRQVADPSRNVPQTWIDAVT
jgi:prolyl 4-hydroxylase